MQSTLMITTTELPTHTPHARAVGHLPWLLGLRTPRRQPDPQPGLQLGARAHGRARRAAVLSALQAPVDLRGDLGNVALRTGVPPVAGFERVHRGSIEVTGIGELGEVHRYGVCSSGALAAPMTLGTRWVKLDIQLSRQSYTRAELHTRTLVGCWGHQIIADRYRHDPAAAGERRDGDLAAVDMARWSSMVGWLVGPARVVHHAATPKTPRHQFFFSCTYYLFLGSTK